MPKNRILRHTSRNAITVPSAQPLPLLLVGGLTHKTCMSEGKISIHHAQSSALTIENTSVRKIKCMCENSYTHTSAQTPLCVVFCYTCHSLLKAVSTIGLCFPSNQIFVHKYICPSIPSFSFNVMYKVKAL
jgi:hypothetical protein